MIDLAGRGAIIVGARRIGRLVVNALVQQGVQPAIVYRSSRFGAESLLDEVKPLAERACLIQADLAVEEDVIRLVRDARDALGNLSFCINLASDYPNTPLDQLNAGAWEVGMAAPRGAYLLASHASRVMAENEGPVRGHHILFGDWAAAATPYKDYLPYLTGKATIHFLTRALAARLQPQSIFVNAISPGPTMRPPDLGEEEWLSIVERAPLARESSADEIATLICALLRSEAVTGQNIRVDSGKHLIGTA